MPKSILFIAPSNSTHSLKWINYTFNNRNFNLVWVSFYQKGDNIDIPKEINYYELKSYNPFVDLIRLKSIIVKHSIDLVHLHYIGKKSYLLLFLAIKKLIISPWGSDINFLSGNLFKKYIVKKLLDKATLITVDASFIADIVKSLITKNIKIERINFGTDTDFFKPVLSKSDDNDFKIISLRNLEKIYSIDTIIEAVFKLENKNNLIVDLYGYGSEKNNLERLVQKYNLEQIIKFKGKYDYSDLPLILNSYNLYISSSSSDAGLAASTSEAMACGVLCVSADNSENRFWMDNECGILFKTYSSDDLMQKIKNVMLLKDSNIQKIKTNARNKILNYNSYQNEMKKMNFFYKKLLIDEN